MMSMNAIHTYGIVTNDFELVLNTITNIIEKTDKKHHCSFSMNDLNVRFEDGTKWCWVKPIDMSRGYRLYKALFDRRLTFEEFEFVMRQNCSGYCEGYEWI